MRVLIVVLLEQECERRTRSCRVPGVRDKLLWEWRAVENRLALARAVPEVILVVVGEDSGDAGDLATGQTERPSATIAPTPSPAPRSASSAGESRS